MVLCTEMIGRRSGLKNLQIMPINGISKRKNKTNKNCKSSTCPYVRLHFQNLSYYLWTGVFSGCFDNGRVLLLVSGESSGRLWEELQFFLFFYQLIMLLLEVHDACIIILRYFSLKCKCKHCMWK